MEKNRKNITRILNEIKESKIGKKNNEIIYENLENEKKINVRNYLPERAKNYLKYYLYDYPKIKIEYVPRYILDSSGLRRVLGRFIPSKKLIQIAYDLYGDILKKVKKHEVTHFKLWKTGDQRWADENFVDEIAGTRYLRYQNI